MKGGNTLTNTGYGKSCCRVLGKLGTQYFTPPDLVFTAQESRTTLPPSLCRQKRNTASLGPDSPRRRECPLHLQAADPFPDMAISALRILQCYCLTGPHHQTRWDSPHTSTGGVVKHKQLSVRAEGVRAHTAFISIQQSKHSTALLTVLLSQVFVCEEIHSMYVHTHKCDPPTMIRTLQMVWCHTGPLRMCPPWVRGYGTHSCHLCVYLIVGTGNVTFDIIHDFLQLRSICHYR